MRIFKIIRLIIIVVFMTEMFLLPDITSATPAQVSVFPSNKTFAPGETSELAILIDPMGTYIAGATLNIAFGRDLVKVNKITEGNFFKQKNANTFFNSGVVNDSDGTVTNIYEAIMGNSNVSNPGIFININLTVINSSGSSGINISNVEISDPNGFLIALNVTNGSITVNERVPETTPPAGVTNLKNISYAENYINWTWTDPMTPYLAKVMVYLDGVYMIDVLKGEQYYNATVTPGTYTIGIKTVDTNGTINATMATHTAMTILPTIKFINGTVIDSSSKKGIPDAIVYTNTSDSTVTNATGFYSFAVTEGTYELTAKFDPVYYLNNTITISTIGSEFVLQDIELTKKPTGTITGAVSNRT
jgi:hypothetical protein